MLFTLDVVFLFFKAGIPKKTQAVSRSTMLEISNETSAHIHGCPSQPMKLCQGDWNFPASCVF